MLSYPSLISADMKPKNPKPEDLPETRLENLIGCTGYRGPARTLEEMEAGIAEGARQRSR